MKKITRLLLILFTAMSTLVMAQNGSHGTVKDLRSIQERLIAEAEYSNNGATFVPYDSAIYSYSGTRVYDSALHIIACDQAIGMSYQLGPDTFAVSNRNIQTFDANNNMLTNTYQLWNTDSNAYINSTNTIWTYDANNNLLTYTTQHWTNTNSWVNEVNKIYTYDANNNRLSYAEQTWNTGTSAWVNDINYLYTYSASNLLTQSVFQHWNGTWQDSTQSTYTYNASNQQTQVTNQYWDPSGPFWYNVDQSQYAYSSAGPEQLYLYLIWSGVTATFNVSSETIYSLDVNNNDSARTLRTWNGSVWTNVNQYLYTYDTNSNQLSQIYQLWDATNLVWKNETRLRTTYDSYNNPTYRVSDDWNTGGFWQYENNNDETFYYYQMYNTDGIENIKDAGGTLSLYPVPASTVLNIDLNWDTEQTAIIAVYDASGRLYHQWQTTKGTAYQSNISVSDLQPGTYYMSVKGVNGQIERSFSVVK